MLNLWMLYLQQEILFFFSFLLAFQCTDRAGATYIYQEHGTWYELKVSQLSNFLIWFACSANSSLNEE